MSFVNELKNSRPSDNQLVTATCNRYIEEIIELIQDAATDANRNGKNSIKGYLAPFPCYIRDVNRDSLALGRLDSGDPIDFSIVFSDLNCQGYNSNSTLTLTKAVFNERVLKSVCNLIIIDGFHIHTLRCDAVDIYTTETKYGVLPFLDRHKHINTGRTALHLYLELSW